MSYPFCTFFFYISCWSIPSVHRRMVKSRTKCWLIILFSSHLSFCSFLQILSSVPSTQTSSIYAFPLTTGTEITHSYKTGRNRAFIYLSHYTLRGHRKIKIFWWLHLTFWNPNFIFKF
jgi:hypothetical protein